jgi:phage terminase large subunit-like protein
MGVELPDAATLRRLKLSPEIAWYLLSRGYELPDCVPAFKTPEPKVRGARFDGARVDKVLHGFSRMMHTQGQWAGRPIILSSWQVGYIVAPVFGWVRFDDDAGRQVRVVRSLYVEVPRRNGKSTLFGGIGLYLTCLDGEAAAQVVAAATTTKQARYVFDPVRELASRSPYMRPYVKAFASRVVHTPTGSYFEVVSSVAEALHGGNLHGGLVDELHVHKHPDLVETIETGTGSRRQPLVGMITTADDGRDGTIYARKRGYVEQLARHVIKDPSTYGVIWCASERDDPFAESTWRKANPGYGVSPTRQYLVDASTRAANSPTELATFMRLHLGVRTKQQTRFVTLNVWDRNAGLVDEQKLHGRRAYGGLDLASTSDLCSLCWLFPDDDGGFDVLWRHWCPEAAYEALVRRTAKNAELWRREGLLQVTDGDVADYGYIRAQINLDRTRFDVRLIGYDPWNSSQLMNDLGDDEAALMQVRQGFASMSPPLKQIAHLLREGTAEHPRFRHGGNPLMRWQTDNLAVAADPAGNVKPDKSKSGDKIDGWSAAVTAMSAYISAEKQVESVYDAEHGLVVI